VWAENLGAGRYRVWNVPALAYNIEMTSIVECAEAPGALPEVLRVIEPGSCFGVRLYFADDASAEQIQSVLDIVSARRPVMAKCSGRLWTAGFRTVADYEWVGSALVSQVQAGIVEIESVWQSDEPAW
jgi:hypothetical protein